MGGPLPLRPPSGPVGTYQAVRVLGARAASRALLVAAVSGFWALAAGTAAGTDGSCHCQTRGSMRPGQSPGEPGTLASLSVMTSCHREDAETW